jgi:hypothetical protein
VTIVKTKPWVARRAAHVVGRRVRSLCWFGVVGPVTAVIGPVESWPGVACVQQLRGVGVMSRGAENDVSADEAFNPWERGGAMSDPQQVGCQSSHRPAVSGSDRGRPSRHPSRMNLTASLVVAAVALMLVAGAVVWSIGGHFGAADFDRGATSTSPASTSPARSEVLPDVAEINNQGPDVTETSIGLIRWTSVQGDRSTLPATVVAATGPAVAGSNDGGELVWESLDGTIWQLNERAATTEVGGLEWSVVRDAERRRLVEVTTGSRLPPRFADSEASRDGLVVSWEVPEGGSGVVDVGGEVFALLNRREEVPWRTVLGIAPSVSYRIQVTDGDRILLAESSPDAGEQAVELTARLNDGRVVLDNDEGVQVWSIAAPPLAIEALDAARPQVSSEWLRWDGQQFVSTDPPWKPTDRVEVAAVDTGLVAVATVRLQRGERAWFTSDGLRWNSFEAPGNSSPASPMPMAAHNGEVILTISNGATTSHWSTADTETFTPLADVPGINERSRGSFGWVAPDPRNSPRLRVSPDGEAWEVLDLSALLGFEASRWATTIIATTIESSIYIIATSSNDRTLLLGTVIPRDVEP